MSCCHFFAQNKENPEFKAFIEKNKGNCFHSGDKNYLHTDCPYFWECAGFTGQERRHYVNANTVINDFGDGRKEIVYYKSDFKVMDKAVNIQVDTSKRFAEVGEYLVPRKPGADLEAYIDMMEKNRRRATDIYYGFAMCNKWTHFFTFTVSPYLVENRYDSDDAKKCWEYTRKALQSFDPDVRILCVPERHESGALHFHALVGFNKPLYFDEYEKLPYKQIAQKIIRGKVVKEGFSTFDKEGRLTCLPKSRNKYFLLPYYEYGERKTTKLGDPLYATSFYPYGINSCAILPQDKDNMAAINYLVNYTNKSDTVGYGQKRYYRTHNLIFKDKAVLHVDDTSIYDDFVMSNDLKVYKDNDRMTVIRNFNVKGESDEA